MASEEMDTGFLSYWAGSIILDLETRGEVRAWLRVLRDNKPSLYSLLRQNIDHVISAYEASNGSIVSCEGLDSELDFVIDRVRDSYSDVWDSLNQ